MNKNEAASKLQFLWQAQITLFFVGIQFMLREIQCVETQNNVNVGVGFATGRKNFIKVLESQFDNWQKCGLLADSTINISIFIAYDTSYNNVDAEEFMKVPDRIKDGLSAIHFIGKDEVDETVNKLRAEGIISEYEIRELFGDHEYHKLRNNILFAALEQKMDYLLFLDDDEYPFIPLKNEKTGELEWLEQNILQTHLRYIQDHDVTFGYHCGYISPIPFFQFGEEIAEKDFKNFIEAVSNDIISWSKMKKLMADNKGITYPDEAIVKNLPTKQLVSRNGVKWFAGSNICLNLTRLKNVAAFYNPPNARGEDTFFCACVRGKSVLRIPAYSFHDGFLKYPEILDGEFPKALQAVEYSDEEVKQRFFKACVGWLRYKPLLLYVIDKQQCRTKSVLDTITYAQKIRAVKSQLKSSITQISAILDMESFLQVKVELDFYASEVQTHYKQFQRVQANWKKITEKLVAMPMVEDLPMPSISLENFESAETVEELAETILLTCEVLNQARYFLL